jgi:RNA polymerase sigma-70 factor, ECF subfamily
MRVNRLAGLAFFPFVSGRTRGCGDESTRMTGSVSLEFAPLARLTDAGPVVAEESSLESATTLDRFLASVERRAFRIAQMAVRDRDDAFDIVQGAMMRLASSYGRRPSEEWKPLFYRILYNGIRDWQRRKAVRSRIFGFLPGSYADDEDGPADPFERVPGNVPEPSRQLMADEAMQRLEQSLGQLPARQQQAFTLRCLEGMDVAETATAMGCSEGSVKTHYFRALQTLRAKLGEVW